MQQVYMYAGKSTYLHLTVRGGKWARKYHTGTLGLQETVNRDKLGHTKEVLSIIWNMSPGQNRRNGLDQRIKPKICRMLLSHTIGMSYLLM